MHETPQGAWVGPDGRARPVRLKGGPLYDSFFDIRRPEEGGLSASRGDLARAYASAVWAYRCIKLRADAVAGVPLVLVGRDGAPMADHPLLTLLQAVNPHTGMTRGDLLRATEAAYNIWGCAYWLVLRSQRGPERLAPPRSGRENRPIRGLVWLNPQTVEAVTDSVRGVVAYRQTVGAQRREYAPEEVIAFRNFDPLDDLGGLSPLSVALSEVNADLNAARFVAAFFANDARPAGLLTTDQPLYEADIERVQTWWARLFRGARNRWKTGLVGGGLKWQTITFAPTDLALADLRAEDRRAICAVFGVPPGLAGAWEAMTYATAREQKATFYEDTVLPQLEYLAGVLNAALLPHYPDLTARGARLAFDPDSIAALRESVTDKAQRLVALYQAGLVTRNEVRAELGMPLLPEGEDGFAPGPPSAGVGQAAPPTGAQPVASSVTASPNGAKPDGRKALRAELGRWERFAVKRVKVGRPLRDFDSAVIPPGLRRRIEEGLASAESVEDVFAVFGDAISDWGLVAGSEQEALSRKP